MRIICTHAQVARNNISLNSYEANAYDKYMCDLIKHEDRHLRIGIKHLEEIAMTISSMSADSKKDLISNTHDKLERLLKQTKKKQYKLDLNEKHGPRLRPSP